MTACLLKPALYVLQCLNSEKSTNGSGSGSGTTGVCSSMGSINSAINQNGGSIGDALATAMGTNFLGIDSSMHCMDPSSTSSNNNNAALIIGVVVAGTVLIVVLVFVFFYCLRKRAKIIE